jgi:hypothetical protein
MQYLSQVKKAAEAQAKADELPAKSFSDELIRYNGIQKWNGAYPQTPMGGKADGLILSLPNANR